MKIRNYLIALLLFANCTELSDKKFKTEIHTKVQIHTSADTASSTAPKLTEAKLVARRYGNEIISGKVKPSDNEQTFAWLDSLQSDNPDTRNFAFQVYKAMVVKSDGALSEAISGYIKEYFSSHPKEFLDKYETLDDQEKGSTQESIAFEFYASGTDYAKDLEEYFGKIRTRCDGCAEADKDILKQIRSTLEVKVRHMVE
jgi:hypothetical protein